MVKKLFKHEFAAYFRLMLPVEVAVLGIGIITRIIMLFENDSIIFKISGVSVWILMVLATFAGSLAMLIFAVMRYYKNLFSYEGYLSFTLPVTPAQHIIVKSVTAVVLDFIATIIAVISLCIAASGNLLTESVKAGVYLVQKLFETFNNTHLVFYIVEIALVLILGSFEKLFLYYACISIGQTAKKHRVLMAVVAYFVYDMIVWVLTTIFQIIFTVTTIAAPEFCEKVAVFITNHAYASVHTALSGIIIFEILFIALCFVISHTIIRKKLNLE